MKPAAVAKKAGTAAPASAKPTKTAGGNKLTVSTANTDADDDSFWVEKLDVDGDGDVEDTNLVWDDEDKVLYATRTAQTSQGGAAASRTGTAGNSFAGRTASGDLYAGHDGNVYKNDSGSWQKYGNGGWNNVQPSGQLNNDWRARGEGETRSNEFSRLRSGGGWGSGSFRPSGGGSRGFGRRR